jgi:hypothetical protein
MSPEVPEWSRNAFHGWKTAIHGLWRPLKHLWLHPGMVTNTMKGIFRQPGMEPRLFADTKLAKELRRKTEELVLIVVCVSLAIYSGCCQRQRKICSPGLQTG